MSVTVILAIGLDASLLPAHNSLWLSAGYFIKSTDSIGDAIAHFQTGDYDLVLLGPTLAYEDQERLTYHIRATNSATPVICLANSCEDFGYFADATFRNETEALLAGMDELLARRAMLGSPQCFAFSGIAHA